MLLVGSVALKCYMPEIRIPKDIDIFCTPEEFNRYIIIHGDKIKRTLSRDDETSTKTTVVLNNGIYVEFDYGYSAQYFADINRDRPQIKVAWEPVIVAPMTTLFALKRSHITHDINWFKHISDYQHIKRVLKDDLSPEELRGEIMRRREANKRHRKPRVNLMAPNEEFFRQYNVRRDFEHDEVHRAVAFYDEPLYTRLKKDQSKAWCSWKAFEALSYEDQIRTVQEEGFVIALERFSFPIMRVGSSVTDPLGHFSKAIRLLATRIWAGRWAMFVVDNYDKIIDYDVDYVQLGMKLMDRE